MAKKVKAADNMPGSREHPPLLLNELEEKFRSLQRKIAKSRKNYLPTHKKEVALARRELRAIQSDLTEARARTARAAVTARRTGTASAQAQLQKAQAARLALAETLGKARERLLLAQRSLHEATPLDRKIAARAKVLEKFERDWEKKMQQEAAEQVLKARKSAIKRRSTARKRAEKKSAGIRPAAGTRSGKTTHNK